MTKTNRTKCLLITLVVIWINSVSATALGDAWVESVQTPQYFAIYVEDVDKSVGWYQDVLGLKRLSGSVADDGSWQIENLGNKHLLVEIIRDNRAKSAERVHGFRKVGFYVPDVGVVAERIAQATGQHPSIVEYEELNQKILQIRDPGGNVIQLMSVLEKEQ